jgi:phospholipase DDHD1
MESWRDFLNTTAMDLMYYMSPMYGQEIFAAVVDRMNDLYRRFITHNPQFLREGGKVSIIGHSLGSVIAYDIVNRYGPNNTRKTTVFPVSRHECNK